jgi:hypothetical protein
MKNSIFVIIFMAAFSFCAQGMYPAKHIEEISAQTLNIDNIEIVCKERMNTYKTTYGTSEFHLFERTQPISTFEIRNMRFKVAPYDFFTSQIRSASNCDDKDSIPEGFLEDMSIKIKHKYQAYQDKPQIIDLITVDVRNHAELSKEEMYTHIKKVLNAIEQSGYHGASLMLDTYLATHGTKIEFDMWIRSDEKGAIECLALGDIFACKHDDDKLEERWYGYPLIPFEYRSGEGIRERGFMFRNFIY